MMLLKNTIGTTYGARYMSAEYHTSMSPKAMDMLDGDPVFEELEAFNYAH